MSHNLHGYNFNKYPTLINSYITVLYGTEFVFNKHLNIHLYFMSFVNTVMVQVLEILPTRDKDPVSLHRQYHGCWCPGDAGATALAATVLTQFSCNIMVLTPEGF